jgi:hypothetical protein
MKKILLNNNSVSLQDFDDEIEDGEDIEVVKDGIVEKLKIKKTELFDAQIFRLFKHSPNSFEFGKAGNRHKIHYFSKEDGEKKVRNAIELEGFLDRLKRGDVK